MKQKPWIISGLLSKKKIRTQLYTVYVAAVFVPISIVGIYLLMYMNRLLTNYYEESIRAESIRVRTIFSELTTQVYKKTTEILFDEEVLRILNTPEYPMDKINTSAYYCASLNQLIFSNIEIEDVTIYTDNSYAADYLHFEQITEELENAQWLKKARNSSISFWTTIERVDSSGNSYWELCLVRRVPGTGSEDAAVMVVRVDDIYLQGRINSKKYGIRILTDNNITCFSSAVRDYGSSVDINIDFEDDYFQENDRFWQDGKQVFYSVSALSMYQTASNSYIMTTSDTAYYEIRRIMWTCLLIIVAAIALPLVLILIFTGYFSNRVTILRHEMKKVSNEEYDILPEFHGEDELSDVFSDLQILVKNIKEKDAKVYETQLRDQKLQNEQQKMEMKMLASQINPHFLYNTLESIRMQALTCGNKDVANSIKLLGKSMRYVLENTGTGFITLKKELDYIETYLKIQKLRFGDRVNFHIVVEPGLEPQEQMILPFLLQPVIENAIVHGLEEITENGHIEIRLELVGELFRATISDNGIGMDEEELDRLREKIKKNTLNASRSIGLGNIDRRIKLCYGKDYGLTIRSIKGEGTKVLLRLPVKAAED